MVSVPHPHGRHLPAARGGPVPPAARQGEQKALHAGGDLDSLRRLPPVAAALLPVRRQERRLPVRGAGVVDPFDRGALLRRRGRHLAPAPALDDLPGRHRHPVVLDGDNRKGEGVLRLHAGAADRDDRCVRLSRPFPLLRLLGGDARPDVLPDRDLGRSPQALRGDQVLPVHPARVGADAPGHPGPRSA